MKNPILFLPTLALSLFLAGCSPQQEEYLEVLHKTGGRIQSHPMIDKGIIYFGSNDKHLRAVELKTGELLWEFRTEQSVQASLLIEGSMLFFQNAGTCYALDKTNGNLIWSNPEDSTSHSSSGIPERFDPWDYHHGAPVPDGDKVWFGGAEGNLRCFDQATGKLIHTYSTVYSAAIRCTPVMRDQVLYFGDWNGRIYALDTQLKDTLWTLRTYRDQPYPTFGQLNTGFLVKDSLLIFGARNPQLTVINRFTGSPVWSHTEADGGWISGDPCISGDTLYIGGSDSHKMFAFNIRTGELIWQYEFLFNNFSKPLILGDHLFFPSGDAYAYAGEDYGTGYIFALNRKDGSLVNVKQIGGNAFTSPIQQGNKIYLGSDDGNLYAVDYKAFLADSGSLGDRGYNSIDSLRIHPNPFDDSTSFSFHLNQPATIRASIIKYEGDKIRGFKLVGDSSGSYTIPWDATDSLGVNVPRGYYILRLRSGEYCLTGFIGRN